MQLALCDGVVYFNSPLSLLQGCLLKNKESWLSQLDAAEDDNLKAA